MRKIILLIPLLLMACAPPAPEAVFVPKTVSWKTRQQALNTILNWDLKGVIGLRTATEAVNASLQWKQRGDHYTMLILGPIGAGSVRIKGSPEEVLLQTAQRKEYKAADAESLLYQHTGWQLPVSYLKYWIRGLPAPGVKSRRTYDAYHHIQHLIQAGWDIEFQRYISVNEVDLPNKIQLTHPALGIRIVIKTWEL